MIECPNCHDDFPTVDKYLDHCAETDVLNCRFCGYEFPLGVGGAHSDRVQHLRGCDTAQRLLALSLLTGDVHECYNDKDS